MMMMIICLVPTTLHLFKFKSNSLNPLLLNFSSQEKNLCKKLELMRKTLLYSVDVMSDWLHVLRICTLLLLQYDSVEFNYNGACGPVSPVGWIFIGM